MTFLKKYWLQILIAFGLIFLLVIIFRGCNPAADHTSDKQYVDSVIQVNALLKKQAFTKLHMDRVIDSLNQWRYDSMLKVHQVDRLKVDEATAKANLYAFKYQQARELHDTILSFVECDTLALVAQDQAIKIHGYEKLTDSLVSAHAAAMLIRQGQYESLNALYMQTDTALNGVAGRYNGLYKDYTKVVKANKFNKTLSRVLAIAVVVLGGSLYLTNK